MEKTRPKKRRMSIRRLHAIKIMSENVGISAGEAMRMAKYSQSYSENPQRLLESKEVIKEFARQGLTPDKAINSQRELTQSVKEYEKTIYWPKQGKRYVRPTDDVIKAMVEIKPGRVVKYIQDFPQYHHSIVMCIEPNNDMRSTALDRYFKIGGSYAPTRVEVLPPSDMSEKEREQYVKIIGANKK